MDRESLLKEMKNSVGNKDPIEFFGLMVDVFTLLFDKIETLENHNEKLRVCSALAIQWEPKLASSLLSKQIDILRKDKDVYFNEISSLKEPMPRAMWLKLMVIFVSFGLMF